MNEKKAKLIIAIVILAVAWVLATPLYRYIKIKSFPKYQMAQIDVPDIPFFGLKFINNESQILGGYGDTCVLLESGKEVGRYETGGFTRAMNDKGQVIYTENSHLDDPNISGAKSFFWDKDSGKIEIPSLGGVYTSAIAINNTGRVVGLAEDPRDRMQAFIWDKDNGTKAIDIPDANYSSAWAINDKGQVAGIFRVANKDMRVFIWDDKNGLLDIGNLGGTHIAVMAMNNKGQIVGEGITKNGNYSIFFWDKSQGLIKLGIPGGRDGLEGHQIDDTGRIVGVYEDSIGRDVIFVWDINKGKRDLARGYSGHHFINRNGWAVLMYGKSGFLGPFSGPKFKNRLWSEKTGSIDIKALLISDRSLRDTNISIVDFNDKGQIILNTYDPDSGALGPGYLLSPIKF